MWNLLWKYDQKMLETLVQVCSHKRASVCVAHFAMWKILKPFIEKKLLLENANAYEVSNYWIVIG